jgi:hypothetical protein
MRATPILVGGLFLAGCSTATTTTPNVPRGAFLFQTWIGHAPATDQERKDSEECIAVAVPNPLTPGENAAFAVASALAGPLAFAVVPKAFDPGWLPRWKACIRDRGYQLDEYHLTPEGEWVKR